jgi:AcrR family transcriptional regulator
MGRRYLGRDINERILDEVMKEAARKGISGVSTKAIAHRLKISEPVIFLRFKNKHSLIDAAFLQAWRPFQDNEFSALVTMMEEGFITPEKEEAFYQLVKKGLHYKKEVTYLYLFSFSSYFNFDLADASTHEKKKCLSAYFQTNRTVDPSYNLDLIADLYIGQLIMLFSFFTNKIYEPSPHRMAFLSNYLRYGVVETLQREIAILEAFHVVLAFDAGLFFLEETRFFFKALGAA